MQKLPSDLSEVDIALVVTSSQKRADLINAIAGSFNVRFWVIEKVLAQSCADILSASNKSHGSSALAAPVTIVDSANMKVKIRLFLIFSPQLFGQLNVPNFGSGTKFLLGLKICC